MAKHFLEWTSCNFDPNLDSGLFIVSNCNKHYKEHFTGLSTSLENAQEPWLL